ncbi:hypothetical protein VNI00_012542 [Paramarasmius palmivorus]|uniref:Uncharacterized protein n=1 Tax=Paramarasmius palmivorus TaxID=297713 RepID=A0AAW0C502_9AGAR
MAEITNNGGNALQALVDGLKLKMELGMFYRVAGGVCGFQQRVVTRDDKVVRMVISGKASAIMLPESAPQNTPSARPILFVELSAPMDSPANRRPVGEVLQDSEDVAFMQQLELIAELATLFQHGFGNIGASGSQSLSDTWR